MRYLLGCLSLGLAFTAHASHASEEAAQQPVLSSDGWWVPIMLMVIGAMFVMAAFIGWAVDRNAIEEPPVAGHGHDDAHSDSHHGAHAHGHGLGH